MQWRPAAANAIGYALHRSRSHDAVIRVYDAAGNVIETHEHKGEFKEPSTGLPSCRVSGKLPSMEAEIDCKLQSNSR